MVGLEQPVRMTNCLLPNHLFSRNTKGPKNRQFWSACPPFSEPVPHLRTGGLQPTVQGSSQQYGPRLAEGLSPGLAVSRLCEFEQVT